MGAVETMVCKPQVLFRDARKRPPRASDRGRIASREASRRWSRPPRPPRRDRRRLVRVASMRMTSRPVQDRSVEIRPSASTKSRIHRHDVPPRPLSGCAPPPAPVPAKTRSRRPRDEDMMSLQRACRRDRRPRSPWTSRKRPRWHTLRIIYPHFYLFLF